MDLDKIEAEARAALVIPTEHPMLADPEHEVAAAWARDALALIAEVRRLRAALGEIVDWGEGALGEREVTRDIARQALGGPP